MVRGPQEETNGTRTTNFSLPATTGAVLLPWYFPFNSVVGCVEIREDHPPLILITLFLPLLSFPPTRPPLFHRPSTHPLLMCTTHDTCGPCLPTRNRSQVYEAIKTSQAREWRDQTNSDVAVRLLWFATLLSKCCQSARSTSFFPQQLYRELPVFYTPSNCPSDCSGVFNSSPFLSLLFLLVLQTFFLTINETHSLTRCFLHLFLGLSFKFFFCFAPFLPRCLFKLFCVPTQPIFPFYNDLPVCLHFLPSTYAFPAFFSLWSQISPPPPRRRVYTERRWCPPILSPNQPS